MTDETNGQRSFDKIRARCRRSILDTRPVHEASARGAVERLLTEVAGRRPRVVLFAPSPSAAMQAARCLKAEVVQNGLERRLFAFVKERQKSVFDASVEAKRQSALERETAQLHRMSLGRAASMLSTRLAQQDRDEPVRAAHWLVAAWPPVRRQCSEAPCGPRLDLLRRNGLKPPRLTRRRPLEDALPLAIMFGELARETAARRRDAVPSSTRMSDLHYHLLRDALHEAQLFWLFEECAIVCDRPEVISVDVDGRLHASEGPAVRFRDGSALHSVHGVEVPARVIDEPEKITVEDVDSQWNAEVRRVLLDRMGLQRYLELAGAKPVHRDETGVLWRREVMVERQRPDSQRPTLGLAHALAFVEVVNGTPEPDGTYKRYFLRVPPGLRTARAAVAWTYGLTEAQYVPARRT
jgi:hypothetical protein